MTWPVVGHELLQRGYRVLFIAAYAPVQRLLVAKRELGLEHELAVLDGLDAVILDDIGYRLRSPIQTVQRAATQSPDVDSNTPVFPWKHRIPIDRGVYVTKKCR